MSNWTEQDLIERGKRFLSEQERARAASGFAGALSEIAGLPMPIPECQGTAGGEAGPINPHWTGRADDSPRRENSQAEDWIRRTTKPTRKPRAHPERDLQQSCEALLQLDGWRIFRMEQNYSERKKKVVGEPGVPDTLAVRYNTGTTPQAKSVDVQLWWLEWKSVTGKLSQHQRLWHAAERARGALTLVAGQEFPATVDGFLGYYRQSGLMRKKL